MLMLIMACAFGTGALLVLGITMKSEREIMQERMQVHGQGGIVVPTAADEELSLPFGQRIVLPFLRNLATMASRFTPAGALHTIDEKLETAGRPWGLGSREFMGLKLLSIAAFTILGIVIVNLLDAGPFLRLFFLAILVFIGIIIPDYALQNAINNRQAAIRRVLADTLDLLTVSVEAGLGLDGAMQRVVEKFHNPLSVEMERALGEMRIGKLRMDALRDMAKRMKVEQLTTFVAAICQAEQLGVSIANVLRVQGDTLRTQRSQRARETAAKLPVKMLFPLVFFIFPAIFVVILTPGIIRIAEAFQLIQ